VKPRERTLKYVNRTSPAWASGTFDEVEKRWIIGLLAAITVALAGLVAIQVKWVLSTTALKEEQFARSVEHALLTVGDRLELEEKMRDLRRHPQGRRLLMRLDTLRRMDAPGRRRSLLVEERALLRAQAGTDGGIAPSTFMVEAHGTDSLGLMVRLGNTGDEGHEALVREMVRGILAEETARDIRERIDPDVLDTLLAEELAAVGIPGPYVRGVFAEGGERVLPPPGTAEDPALAVSPFRVRLFRHDPAGTAHYLHLSVPGQRGLLLRGALPMLVTSAVFVLIIVLAFLHTIRTILRQKRIGDIRDDLVNNLTHELKTPISTISLACEAMADPSMPKTEEQVRGFTAMIRDENKRLGALVENVLQSAVLDSGQMLLKRVELDLHALVRDVVRGSGMQVSRRNGRIETDLRAEIHHLHGDRIHLTNLLYNLIDNAMKYTEQEPVVRITTRSDDEGITLSVADNGIGIPAGEQRKVFDRLYRVPTGNIHNAKGFGLGLSYVRTVVERHGGRIKLDSAPGRGSTFHVRIPFEHARNGKAAAGRG